MTTDRSHSPGKKSHDDELPPIDDLLSNLNANQIYDYLRVNKNKQLEYFLSTLKKRGGHMTEKVQFSERVIKINRKQKRQTRQLVITNKAIYNFKGEQYWKCKRRILLTDLKGLVLSHGSSEFVFQVRGEYDYRFIIKHRMEALKMIARYYEQATAHKIPVIISEEQDLSEHVVTRHPGRPTSPSLEGQLDRTPRISRPGSTEDEAEPIKSPSVSEIPTDSPKTPKKSRSLEKSPRMERMEGWLTKKKGSSAKWDRKYFMLIGHVLHYYTPRIKGNVAVGKSVRVEQITGQSDPVLAKFLEQNKTSGKAGQSSGAVKKAMALLGISNNLNTYRARIETKDRKIPLEFAAESEAELKRWIHAFQHPEEKSSRHLEGWLMKKDPASESWRKRYFVLVKERCWYYEMVPKGQIDLRGGASGHASGKVQPTESQSRENFAGIKPKSRFAYQWNVSDSERIFYLAADTQEDMNNWIKAVEAASRRAAGTTAASATTEAGLPEEIMEAIEQEAPKDLVTFVFTDVQGSTTLWEKVPDAMDVCLELHDKIMRRLLQKYNGYEVKTEGDAFMVTFFSPLDALLWCMAVQEALFQAEWLPEFIKMESASRQTAQDETGKEIPVFNGIRIRMGVHCGKPNCRRNPITGRMDYFGPVVNQSARVSDVAHGGQVVCTQEVMDVLLDSKSQADERLPPLSPVVTDHGFHVLKGIKDKVKIYQVLPKSLKLRTFPPLRSIKEKEKEKDKDKKDEKEGEKEGVPPKKEDPDTKEKPAGRRGSSSQHSNSTGEAEEGEGEEIDLTLEEPDDEESDTDEEGDGQSEVYEDEEDSDSSIPPSLSSILPTEKEKDGKKLSTSAKRKLKLSKNSPATSKPGSRSGAAMVFSPRGGGGGTGAASVQSPTSTVSLGPGSPSLVVAASTTTSSPPTSPTPPDAAPRS